MVIFIDSNSTINKHSRAMGILGQSGLQRRNLTLLDLERPSRPKIDRKITSILNRVMTQAKPSLGTKFKKTQLQST